MLKGVFGLSQATPKGLGGVCHTLGGFCGGLGRLLTFWGMIWPPLDNFWSDLDAPKIVFRGGRTPQPKCVPATVRGGSLPLSFFQVFCCLLFLIYSTSCKDELILVTPQSLGKIHFTSLGIFWGENVVYCAHNVRSV